MPLTIDELGALAARVQTAELYPDPTEAEADRAVLLDEVRQLRGALHAIADEAPRDLGWTYQRIADWRETIARAALHGGR